MVQFSLEQHLRSGLQTGPHQLTEVAGLSVRYVWPTVLVRILSSLLSLTPQNNSALSGMKAFILSHIKV